MIKNNFNTVKATFRAWNRNRTPLPYKLSDKEFIAAEDEEFRPLYTADKNDKFYKIRKDILPNYWISNRGNLINVNPNSRTEKIRAIKPSYSGREGSYREQYSLTVNDIIFKPDPAVLVALAFDGKATPKALELINEYGIDALRAIDTPQPMVQLHHISHYKHTDKEDIEALRAENCRIDNLKFLAEGEHDLISNAPRSRILEEGETLTDKEINKEIEYINKLRNYFDDENIAFSIEQTSAKKDSGIGKENNWISSFLRIKPNLDEKYVKYFEDLQNVEHEMSDESYYKCLYSVAFHNQLIPGYITEDEAREFQNLISSGKIKLIKKAFKALTEGVQFQRFMELEYPSTEASEGDSND